MMGVSRDFCHGGLSEIDTSHPILIVTIWDYHIIVLSIIFIVDAIQYMKYNLNLIFQIVSCHFIKRHSFHELLVCACGLA